MSENNSKQSKNSKNQQQNSRVQRRSLIGFGAPRKSSSKESKVQPNQNQTSTLNRLKNIKFGKTSVESKFSKDSNSIPSNKEQSEIKSENSNASSKSSKENSSNKPTSIKAPKMTNLEKAPHEKIQVKVKHHYSPLKIQQADQFSFSAVKQKQVPFSTKKVKHDTMVTAKGKGSFDDSFDQFDSNLASPRFINQKKKQKEDQRQPEKDKMQVNFSQKCQIPSNNPQKGQYLELQAPDDVFSIKSLNMFSHNYSANAFRTNAQVKKYQKVAQIAVKQEKLYNTRQQALIDRKATLPRHYENLLDKFGLRNFKILDQKLKKLKNKQ